MRIRQGIRYTIKTDKRLYSDARSRTQTLAKWGGGYFWQHNPRSIIILFLKIISRYNIISNLNTIFGKYNLARRRGNCRFFHSHTYGDSIFEGADIFRLLTLWTKK